MMSAVCVDKRYGDSQHSSAASHESGLQAAPIIVKGIFHYF